LNVLFGDSASARLAAENNIASAVVATSAAAISFRDIVLLLNIETRSKIPDFPSPRRRKQGELSDRETTRRAIHKTNVQKLVFRPVSLKQEHAEVAEDRQNRRRFCTHVAIPATSCFYCIGCGYGVWLIDRPFFRKR
jgi:hypothetical protein